MNYLAILVAAAVNMVIGMLWYGPLFGKVWMGMMGFTPESMKSMRLTAGQAIGGGVVTSIVMAYVLSMFSGFWEASGVAGAFGLAFWIWLGFVATTQVGSFLWENRPFKLFAFNTVASLIGIFAMALVVVLWQ